MEDKRKTSISWKLRSIVLLPTALLGMSILIIGIVLIYEIVANIVQAELENVTYILEDSFELTISGDYQYEDGILKKGNVNLGDPAILYDIKNKSEVDITIFGEKHEF